VGQLVPGHARLGEHLPAVHARVAHLLLVPVCALLVLLQAALLLEGLVTAGAWEALCVPELAVAEVDVPPQVGAGGEGLATVWAQEGLLVRVHAQMDHQIRVLLELLGALGALEG